MFNNLANLKSKLIKNNKVAETVSGKELLFRHWHRVLLGYAVCNVVFILTSLCFIIGFGSSEGVIEVAVPESSAQIKSNLESVTQLQRYKDLVRSGAINVSTDITI